MSCLISHGRGLVCKDSIGGLDAIYLINDNTYDFATDIEYNVGTDVIKRVEGVSTLYKFNLKGANSFDQNVQPNADAGTNFIQQVLTAQLLTQDATMHSTFKMLMYSRPHVVVKTRSNQFFLAGAEYGMDMTAGGTKSGAQMGDMNGYDVVLTGNERILANFLDCTNEVSLLELFHDASVVNS